MVGKLFLDKSVCSACDICLANCPKAPESRSIFRCRHCAPSFAPCAKACEKGAIFEAAPGLLAIDPAKCDGCGKCAKACPRNAILMQGGKAVKCDLCLGNPLCASSCPEGALRFAKERENVLGWRVAAQENCARDEYVVKGIPELSAEEEALVLELKEEFKEASRSREAGGPEAVRALLAELLGKVCLRDGIGIDTEQEKYLVESALLDVRGSGVLHPLLLESEFEEIAVVGVGKPIYAYHRERGWLRTNCFFTREDVAVDAINRMARALGRRVTLRQPRLNAVLPDGSRLHASIPPISGVEMTIRRFRKNPISIADLIRYRTYSAESLAFLWLASQGGISLIVAGNTASGKTSTLNALFSFIPLNERVLITEETPEISIPHGHSVKLLANQELGIGMDALVADSLRMRPDRVIVGEVRTREEVSALFETILSGQARGSFATFHAQSGEEALARLCSMGVSRLDLRSLDLVVVQRRMARFSPSGFPLGEIRRCVEICEVGAKGEPVPLFEHDYALDKLRMNARNGRVFRGISRAFGISEDEVGPEIQRRAEFLASLAARNAGFSDCVLAISSFGVKNDACETA